MITNCIGDVYRSDVNIIYNPVSIRNDHMFQKKVRIIHPDIYNTYRDMVYNDTVKLGEIQLLPTSHEKQCMMNGFCYDKRGKINILAFTKTLVELCNVANEYHLSVGIDENVVKSEIWTPDRVRTIIEEVFRGTDVEVKIFKYQKTTKRA